MKPVKLVHPSHAKTVLTEDDARRLRASGWLELRQTKSVTSNAEKQRQYRAKQRLLGNKVFVIWLPPESADAIQRKLRPGETLNALFARLLGSDDQ